MHLLLLIQIVVLDALGACCRMAAPPYTSIDAGPGAGVQLLVVAFLSGIQIIHRCFLTCSKIVISTCRKEPSGKLHLKSSCFMLVAHAAGWQAPPYTSIDAELGAGGQLLVVAVLGVIQSIHR